MGSNYIPATAINELEMWQEDTFDPKRIDLELGWAQSLGMNTMRVFLHDLLWEQDAARLQEEDRHISDDCEQTSHSSAVRAVRLLLGSRPALGQAARADARRA